MKSKMWLFLGLVSALALVGAACGGQQGGGGGGGGQELSGSISGAGSSAQAAAVEAWTVGFQEQNPGATVSYDPVGSGGGREQFIAGGVDFGGSDAALEEDELKDARERCGEVIEMPAYISPIAVAFNVEGVDKLQLSPDTLASIFKGEIENWNDPAIARDNPGAQLPDLRITPVHRSDESGTTENFADYLAEVSPDIWDFEVDGNWPIEGGEAGDGTSGVVDAIKAGNGAIGYADASQVGDLPVATIKVGDAFVGPTPEAAAAILDTSEREEGRGEYSFTYDLKRDTEESGVYPIVLLSYELACTEYDDPQKAQLVKAFMQYVISPEGQNAAAENAGSAPMTDGLRQQLQPAVDAISARSGGGGG